MSTKYAGMDVHSATTTYSVIDERGATFMNGCAQTKKENLVAVVKGIPGEVHLTFEEGVHSSWLYDFLKPYVSKLIVCNPRRNRYLRAGNKSDEIDASKLAELLRLNALKPVYHGESSTHQLRDLCRGRSALVQDRTRVKNRLNFLFRARGITVDKSLYKECARERWLSEMDLVWLRTRATWLFEELDALDVLVEKANKELIRACRKHTAFKLLMSVPGIAKIRAATILAEVITPFRFRTKRQFWSYCGFAVIYRTTGDYKVVDGKIKKKKQKSSRGLTRNFNRNLKEVFKGAAMDATSRGDLVQWYKERVAENQQPDMVRLSAARKLAAITLAIWKKGERYDREKALKRTT